MIITNETIENVEKIILTQNYIDIQEIKQHLEDNLLINSISYSSLRNLLNNHLHAKYLTLPPLSPKKYVRK